jgi:MoxR-like ATPase
MPLNGFPYFKGGSGEPPDEPVEIETLPRRKFSGGYIAGPELQAAVNVALILGQPLLVTGEPGTGKTELGFAIARELGLQGPHLFVVKSTSEARDLFYQYDALGRFQARQTGDAARAADALNFIHYQALGQAILEAMPPADLIARGLVHSGYAGHQAPRRAVVIIDEIDKAQKDFPNDLLDEIDNMRFGVAELNAQVEPSDEAKQKFRPVVIITSNSERQLPPAFLRRCVYHHIPFPKRETLEDIVRARVLSELGTVAHDSKAVRDAVSFFLYLRGEDSWRDSGPDPALAKAPGTAELVNFLRVLLSRRALGGEPLEATLDEPLLEATLGVLLKVKDDLDRPNLIAEFLSQKGP